MTHFVLTNEELINSILKKREKEEKEEKKGRLLSRSYKVLVRWQHVLQ